MNVDEQRVAIYAPGMGMGAPIAAAHLEELIAFGCRKFIRCDGCGVLAAEIGCGDIRSLPRQSVTKALPIITCRRAGRSQ